MSITGSAKAVRRFLLRPTQGPATILLIRLAVGLIFSTQGILKYIDPNMGVVRFTRIGFAHPYFTAHFVGTRSEEHTSELQSLRHLVCRLLLEKKNNKLVRGMSTVPAAPLIAPRVSCVAQ